MSIPTFLATVISMFTLWLVPGAQGQKTTGEYQQTDKTVTPVSSTQKLNGGKNSMSTVSRNILGFRNINIKEAHEIAVYPYDDSSETLKAPAIDFGITDRSEVKKILEAISSSSYDGSRMGAMPVAFIFFKNGHGIKRGTVIGWEYVLFDDDWKNLHPLEKSVGNILKNQLDKTTASQ